MSNETGDVRWGIVAPGNIATAFATALQGVEGAVCHSVASRNKARAQAFAEQFGFTRSFGDLAEMLADPALDAVYIASPHNAHCEQAIAALRAAKAVLCEKPLTVNTAQAQRVIDCANQHGGLLIEAVWTRFLPAYAQLRKWLDEQRIGEVAMVQASFGLHRPFDPAHRLYDPALAGGSVLDVGIYPLTLSDFVFADEPLEIQASGHIGHSGVDERVAISLRYAGGGICNLASAISVETRHDAFVYGETGYIHIHPRFWQAETLSLHRYGVSDAEETISLPHRVNGYEYEAVELQRCLRAGEQQSPLMPWDASLRLMRCMDAIRARLGVVYPFE